MAMTSKKLYVEIARGIDGESITSSSTGPFADGYRDSTKAIAYRLASIFAADNARFDRARFLSACGLGE